MFAGESVPYRRWPWFAATLTLGAGLAHTIPNLESGLAFNREASLSGQWWRLITGHFCHYNRSHVVGDVAAFFVWAAVVELVSRRHLVMVLIATFTLVGIWLLGAAAAPVEYRGLSAVDCALAAQLITLSMLDQRVRQNRWLTSAISMAGAIFAAKSCYEFATCHAVLAPELGQGVRLCPQAHVLGISSGVLSGLLSRAGRNAKTRRRGHEAMA